MSVDDTPPPRWPDNGRLGQLEARVRKLEIANTARAERLRVIEREQDRLVPIVEAIHRADLVAEQVAAQLRGADLRGWSRRERLFATLGAGGLVVSLLLQAAALARGF